LLSFYAVMRETLYISKELDGKIWKHRKNERILPSHRHTELEVNLVIQGRAGYLIDEKHYRLQTGTQCWFFPAQEHVLLEQSDDFEMWIVVFKPRLIQKFCHESQNLPLRKRHPSEEVCRQIPAGTFGTLTRIIDEVSLLSKESDRYNAGLGFILLNAWKTHLEAQTGLVANADVHPAVEKAALLLQAHPEMDDMDEVAKRSGLSSSRLSRLFKKQTGISFVDFRNRQRLERMLKLYGLGQRFTMLRAALESGFGSYIQFYRVFNSIMKCTPAEYRRKHIK